MVIEEVSVALIREYLNRKKCKGSLEILEKEMPRTSQSLCNRAEIAQALHIAPLVRKNKSLESPWHSVVEMLVWDILRRHKAAAKDRRSRSRSPKRPDSARPNSARAKVRMAAENDTILIENLELDDDVIPPPKETSLKPSKFYQPPSSPAGFSSSSSLTNDSHERSSLATPSSRPQSGKGRNATQAIGQGLRATNNFAKQKPKKVMSVLEMLSASPEKVMSSHESERKESPRVKTPERENRRSPTDRKPRPRTAEKTEKITTESPRKSGHSKQTTILQDLEEDGSDSDITETKCLDWLDRSRKPNFRFDPDEPGMTPKPVEEPTPVTLVGKSKANWQNVKTKMARQPRRVEFEMNIGVPLDFHVAVRLRQIVFGSSSIRGFREEWSNQSFGFRNCADERTKRLRFGIIQKKGGPCGILAVVQGFMLKHLLFGRVGNLGSEVTEASPNQLNVPIDVRTSCLAEAIIEIIWRAGGGQKGIVALLSTRQSFQPAGTYKADGITEYVITNECHTHESLHKMIYGNIQQFEHGRGAAVLLLYSAILSHGLTETVQDMDDPGNTLMGAHAYCTQEMINLLTVGVAASNVFDNKVSLDGGVVLRGVTTRSDIGLLSLFEHYGSCKVGTNLKTPRYPIWIVCSESHFSVLFSLDRALMTNWTAERMFNLYYYDGLAHQDEEVKLTVHTMTSEKPPQDPDDDLIPPLEHCIRTKWPDALVDWNGTEPLL